MASLVNKQIDETYEGLIKTNDEAAVGATPKTLQDGAGNDLPIAIATDRIVYSGTQDFTGATVEGVETLPVGGTTGQVLSKVDNTDYNVEWSTPSSGGGGRGTQSIYNIAPTKSSFFGAADSFRTWVPVNGYTYGSSPSIGSTKATWSVFGIAEGDTISKIYLNVRTAATTGSGKVGIYQAKIDSNNLTVIGELLQDCGTFTSTTTGDKTITLATPFTMPAGQPQGAVCIVVGGDTDSDDFAIAVWSQAIWTGNGGVSNSGTFYRNMGIYLNSWDGTHKDYTSGTYGAETSGPAVIAIR